MSESRTAEVHTNLTTPSIEFLVKGNLKGRLYVVAGKISWVTGNRQAHEKGTYMSWEELDRMMQEHEKRG